MLNIQYTLQSRRKVRNKLHQYTKLGIVLVLVASNREYSALCNKTLTVQLNCAPHITACPPNFR